MGFGFKSWHCETSESDQTMLSLNFLAMLKNELNAGFQFVREVFIDSLALASPLQVLPEVLIWHLSTGWNV